MTNSKKLGMVVMAVLLGLSVAAFAVDKESGDKAHWGVAAVRSNGDIDLDGSVVQGTDSQLIQAASITATSATLQTNTFATAFSAAPVVTATYTEDPGDVRPIFVSSVSATQVVLSITADKNYAYTAVGLKP